MSFNSYSWMPDIGDFCSWTQCYKSTDLISKQIFMVWQDWEHLSSALRMANVCNFLKASCLNNEIDTCWYIIKTHLYPIEIPIFLSIFDRVQSLMLGTVLVTSWVSKPYVVSMVDSDESRCLLNVISYPSVWRVGKPMLKEHWWSFILIKDIFDSRNSHKL